MIPLNLKEIAWLAGTADELHKFLTDHKDEVFVFGNLENCRSLLVKSTDWLNMDTLDPLLGPKTAIPASFLLIQGKIVGLIQLPAKS